MEQKIKEILRSGAPNEIMETLEAVFKKELVTPFPYAEVRTLLEGRVDKFDGLIPSLDMHFSTIAGYCSLNKKILTWSNEQLEQGIKNLEKTFFEEYPQYTDLRPLITAEFTPILYEDLEMHELLRVTLLHVFLRLRKQMIL